MKTESSLLGVQRCI